MILLRRLLCIPIGLFGVFWLGSAIYDLFVWEPWSIAGSLFMLFVSYVVFSVVWPPYNDGAISDEESDKGGKSKLTSIEKEYTFRDIGDVDFSKKSDRNQRNAQEKRKQNEYRKRQKQKRIDKQKTP